MKRRYACQAEVEMTVEEYILLNMIRAKTDQILQNIAIATGKNKSVILRMIDSLEQKGLAKRTVNPDDRRENLLSITNKGNRVVLQYQQVEKHLSQELIEGIPPEKVAIFFEVLEQITRKTDQV